MNKIISMVLVCVMMLGLCVGTCLAEEENTESLKTQLEESVSELKEYGILKGDPDGNMRLEDNITRELRF